MFKIAVIGYGYWGPNLVRNIRSKDCDLKYIVKSIKTSNKTKNENDLSQLLRITILL